MARLQSLRRYSFCVAGRPVIKRLRETRSITFVRLSGYLAFACFFPMVIYCAQVHHLDRYTYHCMAVIFAVLGYGVLAARWVEKAEGRSKRGPR
jgi:hypothetical protein